MNAIKQKSTYLVLFASVVITYLMNIYLGTFGLIASLAVLAVLNFKTIVLGLVKVRKLLIKVLVIAMVISISIAYGYDNIQQFIYETKVLVVGVQDSLVDLTLAVLSEVGFV
jgi:hypothetical protein